MSCYITQRYIEKKLYMFTKLSFKDGVLDIDVRNKIVNIFKQIMEGTSAYRYISFEDNVVTIDESQFYTNRVDYSYQTSWYENIKKIDINNFVDGYFIDTVYGSYPYFSIIPNNEFNENYSLVGNYNDFCYHNESVEYLSDYRNITNEYDLLDTNKKSVVHTQWNI